MQANSVAYSEVVPVLIEAVKELKAEGPVGAQASADRLVSTCRALRIAYNRSVEDTTVMWTPRTSSYPIRTGDGKPDGNRVFLPDDRKDTTMPKRIVATLGLALLASTSAHAISDKYSQQLERSGCTQATELQGCDIKKTKAENAKAGFGTAAPAASAPAAAPSPYAGQWIAKGTGGATVATIRIDGKDNVSVNGKKVKAKRSDGALVFRSGKITYTIQGDRRLVGEDNWSDSDAGTKGSIVAQ